MAASHRNETLTSLGETLSMGARPNYEDAEWSVVPIVNALILSFVLEETHCLQCLINDTGYKLVSISRRLV